MMVKMPKSASSIAKSIKTKFLC